MKTKEIIEKIRQTESPLKRHLLMVALITNLLQEKGKEAPIVIGGCAPLFIAYAMHYEQIKGFYKSCQIV